MALERVPADIRKDGGVARMCDPKVGFNLNTAYLEMLLILMSNIDLNKKLNLTASDFVTCDGFAHSRNVEKSSVVEDPK